MTRIRVGVYRTDQAPIHETVGLSQAHQQSSSPLDRLVGSSCILYLSRLHHMLSFPAMYSRLYLKENSCTCGFFYLWFMIFDYTFRPPFVYIDFIQPHLN